MSGEIPPGRLIRPKKESELVKRLKQSPQYVENERLLASQSDEHIRARGGAGVMFIIAVIAIVIFGVSLFT